MGRTATRKRERRNKAKVQIDRRGVGRRWMVRVALAAVIAAGIAAWQWHGILWGYKEAPSFTLRASTGRLVSLQDYRGKKEVVLIFYMGAG